MTAYSGVPILEFTGEFRFLSNFHPATIQLDGLIYPSVEHAYQAAKAPLIRRADVLTLSAKAAKAWGRSYHRADTRLDWENGRIPVMSRLIDLKFGDRHPDLCQALLNTGDRELVEGNWWGDTFWGKCQGLGENNLGLLLMARRSWLRDQTRKPS